MKILLLSNVFPPGFIGGYELGALEVATFLAERGHTLKIMTSDYFLDDEGEIQTFDIDRTLDCPPLSHALISGDITKDAFFVNWRNLRLISSEIRRFQPDLVMCFNIAALGQFGIVALLRHLRLPTLYYFMDAIFDAVDAGHPFLQAFRDVFGANDLGPQASAVFMSKNLEKQVRPRIGVHMGGAYFIPGWIDDAICRSGERPPRNDGKRRFIFSSRVAPHKGTELLIDAVKQLSGENLPEFEVDVFGMGQVTQFVQRCVTNGVDNLIHYRGSLRKAEMLETFRAYDALVFATWPREPYGFVASEAAATGCIPIMTKGIGAAEWFLDGVDSLKINHNAQSLADAMRKVILMSDDDLAKMSHNCMTSAKSNLVMSRWLPEIERIAIQQVDAHKADRNADVYGVQSAMLVLAELWKERCQ